jgi:hypothetical protein
MKKLQGQMSFRSSSKSPVVMRQGQNFRPWFFWFSSSPLARVLTNSLSGLSLNELQDLPGGWGVVLDDVGAGIYAGALLMLSLYVIKY